MSFEKVPNFFQDFFEAEMNGAERLSYRFNSFLLDVAERQLISDGKPIPLTPKAFDLLVYFVQNSGHLVLKDELMEAIWPDSFVDEVNVPRTIHTLRRALGEDESDSKFIETVPTKGYRFVAHVESVNESISPGSSPAYVRSDVERPPEIADVDTAAAKHPARIVLFTVGFATAVILLLLLSFSHQPGSSVSSDEVRSIAVLPIKPLSAENRDPIYEFGIAESLILKLSLVKGLIVRPLSAMRKYADIEQDAVAAGKEQKVDYVLASNYQIADGRIRITSQLFNVANGQVEDVFKDDRENSGIFALQDAVAANIGGSLLKRFNRGPNELLAKRYTSNEEAYRLYLQGSALVDKRSMKQIGKAIEYFEQAVQLDPNYALAYAKLANAHAAIIQNAGDRDEHYPKAKAAIEKALAIDDNLSDAHAYSGEIKHTLEWDFAGAELEHKRSVELDPNSSIAHRMYSLLLTNLGRHDEAIATSKTAVDLEPASGFNQQVFGRALLFARRYDEAIAVLERLAESDTERFHAQNSLSLAYRYKGDGERAFESLTQAWAVAGDTPAELDVWRAIYAKSGWQGVLERQFEDAKARERDGKPNYGQLSNLASELGHTDEAFAYLEKVFAQRSWGLVMLNIHPRYDPIRRDPRFDGLVKRVGLE